RSGTHLGPLPSAGPLENVLAARGCEATPRRSAAGLPNFSAVREAEDDAHGVAIMAQIVEHNAPLGRRDLLQPERGGRKRIEARPPVGFEFGAAFADLGFAAPAFERRIIR